MSYKIVVMSCDKNQDLWLPFYLCMEKYWKGHPQIICSSETLINPYYDTINFDYPIEKWTKRVYDTIKDLECDNVLLMIDDLFVRTYVDNDFINSLERYIGGSVGAINFEKQFDSNDIPLDNNVSIRNPFGKWRTSVMCQMWQKETLLDIFNCDKDPWTFESDNNGKGYIFLISKNGNFINWGYGNRKWFGIRKGKWCRECKDFFDKEGIKIDYSIRGFYE